MKKSAVSAKDQMGSEVAVASNSRELIVPAPNFKTGVFVIRGNAPLMINAFSNKAREQIKQTQEAGSRSRKGKAREAKDFNQCYEDAKHVSTDGWCGIPCAAFRNAMVSACRVVGFAMTRAKLSVFIEADGFDRVDQTPLVKITKGNPENNIGPVRLDNGVVDLRARPMWKAGWEAVVRIRFDGDQFSIEDVANLLVRVGIQVGLCEGRPDSKKSCGMGFGTFNVIQKEAEAA